MKNMLLERIDRLDKNSFWTVFFTYKESGDLYLSY